MQILKTNKRQWQDQMATSPLIHHAVLGRSARNTIMSIKGLHVWQAGVGWLLSHAIFPKLDLNKPNKMKSLFNLDRKD